MIDKEIIDETLPFNKSYLRTVLALFRYPEKVIENKALYTKPIKYFTITLGIIFFLQLLTSKLIPYWGDIFPWTNPQRLAEFDRGHREFGESFDPILLPILFLPFTIALNFILFKVRFQQNLQLSLFLLAQLSLIELNSIPVLSNHFFGISAYNLASLNMILAILYFGYFYLRIKGRTIKVFFKAILIALLLILYYNYTQSIIKYVFAHVTGKYQIFYSPEVKTRHSFRKAIKDLNNLNFGFIRQSNKNIEVITEENGTSLLTKFNHKGKIIGEESMPINVVKIVDLNGEPLLVGYSNLSDTAEHLVIRDNQSQWQYRVGKDMTVADVCTDGQDIFVCGFMSRNNNDYPRLIILKTGPQIKDIQVQVDSIFNNREVRFNSISVDDSTIYLTQVVSREMQASKFTVRGLNRSDLKTIWESTIFSKTSKYSPPHRVERVFNYNRQYVKVLKDQSDQSVYTLYMMPNDTNTSIVLHNIDCKTGRTIYSGAIKADVDRILYHDVIQTDKSLIVVGNGNMVLTDSPFFYGYSLGAVFIVDKKKGNLVKTHFYGSKWFDSNCQFRSVMLFHDTLSVIRVNEYDVLRFPYKIEQLEILRFEGRDY